MFQRSYNYAMATIPILFIPRSWRSTKQCIKN